jgi:hypothetical protein
MSEFDDPAIVKDAMPIALTDEFDWREASRLVMGPTQRPATRKLAYEFVKANFDKILARTPRDYGAGLPRVAASLCTEEARADVEAFFRGRSTRYTGGPRVLDQTLEELRLCSALHAAQRPSVIDFFTRLGASGQR